MCFQLFSFLFCYNDKKKDDVDDDDTIYDSYDDNSDDTKCDKSSLNYYIRNNTWGIDLLG